MKVMMALRPKNFPPQYNVSSFRERFAMKLWLLLSVSAVVAVASAAVSVNTWHCNSSSSVAWPHAHCGWNRYDSSLVLSTASWPPKVNAFTFSASNSNQQCVLEASWTTGIVVDVTGPAQQAHATEVTISCEFDTPDQDCIGGTAMWVYYATPVRGANNEFWPAPYKANCVSTTNDTICASVAVEASVPPPLQCSFPATGDVYHCANTTKLPPLSSVGGAYLLNLRISPILCNDIHVAMGSTRCTLSLQ
jgi:hypothetical protein